MWDKGFLVPPNLLSSYFRRGIFYFNHNPNWKKIFGFSAESLSKTLDFFKIAPKSREKGMDVPLLLVIGVLLLKPVLISHADFQRKTLERLRRYYINGAAVLVHRDWPVIWK